MPKIDAAQFPSTADYNLIDLFSITSFIKSSSFVRSFALARESVFIANSRMGSVLGSDATRSCLVN